MDKKVRHCRTVFLFRFALSTSSPKALACHARMMTAVNDDSEHPLPQLPKSAAVRL